MNPAGAQSFSQMGSARSVSQYLEEEGAPTCSGLPVLGSGKSVPLCHNDGRDTQDTNDGEVDESWLWGAVERVVEPRDKAPHDQQCNS